MTAWVVVPAPRSRLEELRALLTAIDCPPQRCVVVTTDPDPITRRDIADLADHVLWSQHRLHFGEWLNCAFEYLTDLVDIGLAGARHPLEVLCLGSSVKVTGDLVQPLQTNLRTAHLTMVGPDLHGHGTRFLHDRERTVIDRVPGVCFMVPLELGLRFDPQFRWWYSDDDLEMQARQLGPVAVVGGLPVSYDPIHPLTEEQTVWSVEDRARFITKWHQEPH